MVEMSIRCPARIKHRVTQRAEKAFQGAKISEKEKNLEKEGT